MASWLIAWLLALLLLALLLLAWLPLASSAAAGQDSLVLLLIRPPSPVPRHYLYLNQTSISNLP